MPWVFESAAMVAVGQKFRQSQTGLLAFPYTTGENLVYRSEAFSKRLQREKALLSRSDDSSVSLGPALFFPVFTFILQWLPCRNVPFWLYQVEAFTRYAVFFPAHLPYRNRNFFFLLGQLLTCWFPRRRLSLAAYNCGQNTECFFFFFKVVTIEISLSEVFLTASLCQASYSLTFSSLQDVRRADRG